MKIRPMKIRAVMDGDKAMVKAIIFHPMETGLRKNKQTGKIIPAHFIKEVICKHGDKVVLTCLWNITISQNPFMSFRFKGAKSGDKISIHWVDNLGNSDTGVATIS